MLVYQVVAGAMEKHKAGGGVGEEGLCVQSARVGEGSRTALR